MDMQSISDKSKKTCVTKAEEMKVEQAWNDRDCFLNLQYMVAQGTKYKDKVVR